MGGRIDNVLNVNTEGGFVLKNEGNGSRPKTPMMPALNLDIIHRRRDAEIKKE